MSTQGSGPAHTRTVVIVSWAAMGLALAVLILLAGIQSASDPGAELAGAWDNLLVGGLLVIVLACLGILGWVHLRREIRANRLEIYALYAAALDEAARPPIAAHAYVGRAAMPAPSDVDTGVIVQSPHVRRRRRRRFGSVTPAGGPEKVAGLTPEMVDLARRTSARLRGEG